MRAAVQTKKSKRGLKILVAVILILGVLALAFKFVLYDKLKDKAFDMVTKDVVQQMIEENPQLAEDTDIDSIISSVSSEDKAKVEKQLQPRAAFRNEGNISEICKVEIYC